MFMTCLCVYVHMFFNFVIFSTMICFVRLITGNLIFVLIVDEIFVLTTSSDYLLMSKDY